MAGGGTVRELITRLGFEVDDSALNSFEKNIDRVKIGMTAMVGAATAAAAGLFAITLSASKAGEEVQANSDLVGLSVEAYQRYAEAASLAELSNEGFQTSLQFLTRNVGNALAGNKVLIETFQGLGFSMGELKTLKTEDLLQRLQGKFQNMKTPAERAAAAVAIFGRSGARMGRFLSQSTESFARSSAVVEAFGFFTAESAKNADDAGDSFSQVGTLVKGMKNLIGIKLLPVLKKVSDAIVNWAVANQEVIKNGLLTFVDGLVKVLGALAKAFSILFGWIGKITDGLGGVNNVIKILGITALSIFGGSAVTALLSFIKIVRTLGLAFGIAWGEALLPAVLVALAIGAIILVIDDLYTWIKGGDSIFGSFFGTWESFTKRMSEQFGDTIDAIKLAWGGIKELFSGVFDVLVGNWKIFSALWKGDTKLFVEGFNQLFKGFGEIINGAIDGVANLISAVLTGLIHLGKNVAIIIKDLLISAIPPSLLKLIDKVGSAIGGSASGGTNFGGAAFAGLGGIPQFSGASPAGIARPSALSGNGTVNQINVDAKVSVPPGTTQQQADFMEQSMKEIAERTFGRHINHVIQTNPRRE